MKSIAILVLFFTFSETFAFFGPSFKIHNDRPYQDPYRAQPGFGAQLGFGPQPGFGPRFKFERPQENEPILPNSREGGRRKLDQSEDVNYEDVDYKKLEAPEKPKVNLIEKVKEKVDQSEKKNEPRTKKLAACPAEIKFESCETECTRNQDCPESQVCCRFSCGTSCVEIPQEKKDGKKKSNRKETEKEVGKLKQEYFDKIKELHEPNDQEVKIELECPKPKYNITCDELREICKSDSDCSASQKCCKVRCSLRCVGPKGSKDVKKEGLTKEEKNTENTDNNSKQKNKVKSSKLSRGFDSALSMPLQNSYSMFNPFLMQNLHHGNQFMPNFHLNKF